MCVSLEFNFFKYFFHKKIRLIFWLPKKFLFNKKNQVDIKRNLKQ